MARPVAAALAMAATEFGGTRTRKAGSFVPAHAFYAVDSRARAAVWWCFWSSSSTAAGATSPP
eukprot:10640486-Lingulodinium_polyedra.AAC.1